MSQRYGQPRDDAGKPAAISICALGKCGGRELGFASDIELLFVYSADGTTDGKDTLPNATYYQRYVERITQMIRAKREGVFHVDLRLRPYGKAGALAISLAAFEHYYAPEGAAWPFERQALVKLRPIAGNEELGRKLLALRDRLIYTGSSLDASALRAMREKQVRQLVRAGTFHAKLSPGGLVDLEYLVQALQLTVGHQSTDVRTPNTHEAIAALHRQGITHRDIKPDNVLLETNGGLKLIDLGVARLPRIEEFAEAETPGTQAALPAGRPGR
ncbi:MAG: hypothetical protein B7Z55_07095, partial [Planctomycetales bacterium 12-60-4]